MNDKKAKNVKTAREVWRLYHDEEYSMSKIAKKLNLHKTEVSYILKYTMFEMYMKEDEIIKCVANYDKCFRQNKLLRQRLAQAQKPWYKKLFD